MDITNFLILALAICVVALYVKIRNVERRMEDLYTLNLDKILDEKSKRELGFKVEDHRFDSVYDRIDSLAKSLGYEFKSETTVGWVKKKK